MPPVGADAQEARLMRSMLFVPGDSSRKFEKASQSKASALILDLEDSVVPDKKEEARGLTRAMLSGGRNGPRLYVRVNALDTDMTLRDLAVTAIDTVYTDIENLTGLELETRIARRDGFSAKALIHPKHVDIVNAAFEPSAEERAWAEKVIAAFAASPDLGTLRLDGKMIDKPHLRAAKKILFGA
jgi:citrate lyase beta subunit